MLSFYAFDGKFMHMLLSISKDRENGFIAEYAHTHTKRAITIYHRTFIG